MYYNDLISIKNVYQIFTIIQKVFEYKVGILF